MGVPLASSSSPPARGTAAARSWRAGKGVTTPRGPGLGLATGRDSPKRSRLGPRWSRDLRGAAGGPESGGWVTGSSVGSGASAGTDSGHRGCFPQPAFHEDGDTISPSPRMCWNKALNVLKYLKQLKGRFCTARLSPSSLRPHRPATLPSTPGGFPQDVGERTELPFSLRPGTHPRQSPWVICPSLFLLCSFPPRDRRCRRTAAGSDPLPLLSPPPRSFRQRGQRSGGASSPQPRRAPAVPGTVGRRGLGGPGARGELGSALASFPRLNSPANRRCFHR